MKTLITTLTLLLGINVSFSQETVKVKPVKNTEVKHRSEVAVKPNLISTRKFNFFGDYKVTSYYVLKLKTPSPEILESIVGSTVKMTATSMAGSQIKLVSYTMGTTEKMSSFDYITTVFGRELRVKEPDLPSSVLVHHTNNESISGIIELDEKHIALPYQGVLLYLERI